MARAAEARAHDSRFRLVIDRSFTLAGAGTVVTGTVVSGMVSVDDRLIVSPSGIGARVRSIHAMNRSARSGVAGQRCALNLSGENVSKDAVLRGDVVVDPFLMRRQTVSMLRCGSLPANGDHWSNGRPYDCITAPRKWARAWSCCARRPSRRASKRLYN